MKPVVVIVGGTGVFGGRLARRLLAQGEVRVLIAGRDPARLAAFCAAYGGEAMVLDRAGDVTEALAACAPFAVVDAAGPFQSYGDDPYRLVRAAIAVGSHYLDLSDDADFTMGIGALDQAARAAGVAVLSGVSSVPAISAAAVRALAVGITRIALIDTVILPGNRAPRGLSVVRAIVSQVGRPLRIFRGGNWTEIPAWGGAQKLEIGDPGVATLGKRWVSFIGAPDLALFPRRFAAHSVLFRAGLELPIMHLGLVALSWLVRARLLRTLTPLARVLHAVASRLEPFGSDRGGMRVAITGIDQAGCRVQRHWTLIAEAGAGPEIPAIPAFVAINTLLENAIAPGARACLDDLDLSAIEAALPRPEMKTVRGEAPAPVLYERVLGAEFARLPVAVQSLHAVVDRAEFVGEARVEVGSHPVAGLVRWLMRFPAASPRVPVTVVMTREGERERWQRQFGTARFVSVLSRHPDDQHGECQERFGPFAFGIRLIVDAGGISMPVRNARFLGLPLPRFLLPESRTQETADGHGNALFDVEIRLPVIGRVIRYSGNLRRR